MRVVLCAWVVAQLVAAMLSGNASAYPFVLSDPKVDPSWGRQSAQPIAPSSVLDADAELSSDLTGQARARAYVEALAASGVTLDEAARFHFYAPAYAAAFDTWPDRPHVQLETGPAAGAYAAAAGEKARTAEPILQAELDARFVALTAAMEQAGSIVLPSPGAPVTYCRWIARTVHSTMPPLAAALWNDCMADRDRFVDALVHRLADLVVIPDLSSIASTAPGYDGTHLSRAVLPGETLRPMPFEHLDAVFQARLRDRFEAARPRLEAQLTRSLAIRASSDVILPPAIECREVLGAYAGPLTLQPAAASVAGALDRACMDAVARWIPLALERIQHEVVAPLDRDFARLRANPSGEFHVVRTPRQECASALAPHFPAPVDHYDRDQWPFAGLDAAQSTGLRQACLAAAQRVTEAVADRRLAAAISTSQPEADTLKGWTAQGWFAVPPRSIPATAFPANSMALQPYDAVGQASYEAAMAPKRKAAAERFVAGIERAFDVGSGVEPAAAAKACAKREVDSGDDAARSLFSTPFDPAAGRRGMDALRAKTALTAREAEDWVSLTCRVLHDDTIARRVELAVAASNASSAFPGSLDLVVPSHADGSPIGIDPTALVRAAAIDGIQVAYEEQSSVIARLWGGSSGKGMRITPFAATTPAITATLQDGRRPDGTAYLEVTAMEDLPGLHSPEETIGCLHSPSGRTAADLKANRLLGVASAIFSYVPEEGGRIVADTIRKETDLAACDAAKKAFLAGGIAP
jgi:hypothetical protein